jgi:hypothetical protein
MQSPLDSSSTPLQRAKLRRIEDKPPFSSNQTAVAPLIDSEWSNFSEREERLNRCGI